ncbi:hypothetical protein OU997_05210 [Pseudomonas sp. SL4(2022)]|uniref:hypothetical protein n=1 Tax=Pseudomonas sp. SL4(2022) TaxID=2994661 RepID=UPI002270AD5B|nr:hypothetical protein [Pseudomonas sp. SL4(2022)]WAC45571.1 hypothetical protein OU997_05210 [Pseudomonas sp. SL4(2022)]
MIDEFSLNFGQVHIWGWPWHGLISRASSFSPSTLQLPNGIQRDHDMPEQPWYTYRLKVPGVAEVTRTAEQVAADLALGMQWRNEAILCGSGYQMYGKDLGGWIYCAPDGSRWIINRQARTATRMGAIGKPADVRALTVNMPADNGQATPVVSFGSGPVFVVIDEMPSDISPDGRRAILMQYCNDPAYSPGERRIPLGFLLAEVSGGLTTPFALNVTVLHNRAATLGLSAYEDAMTVTNDAFGTPTSATGYEVHEYTGRIWAAWFDTEGGSQTCTLDRRYRFQQESPLSGASGYQHFTHRWRLKVGGAIRVEAELQSEFQSAQTGSFSGVGTLNGETIYNQTIGGYLKAEPKAGPGDVLNQVMSRNYTLSVNAGDRIDLLPFGNNLLAFYVRLTGTGSPQPQHRYIGGATPVGVVAFNTTVLGPVESSPQRNALYGPASYGALNPVTREYVAPSATPIGWT